jgi:beta-alanine degradation protein BauB
MGRPKYRTAVYSFMSIMLMAALFPAATVSLEAQAPVPVGEEPQHHVVFKNGYVRVIDAVFPPGYVSLFHTHSADNVPVTISGGKIRTELPGEQTTESEAVAGRAYFAKATYTHRISNIGATTVRFIDAEILAVPPNSAASSTDGALPGRKLESENDRVRIYRLTLAPGRSTASSMRTLGWLEVTVRGGKIARSLGPERETVEVKPGDFLWHAPRTSYTVTNAGPSTYEAIEIEWKPGMAARKPTGSGSGGL